MIKISLVNIISYFLNKVFGNIKINIRIYKCVGDSISKENMRID